MYWAWDLRPIWLDARPVLDAGILDNESGTNIELEGQDPIKASFGQRHASSASRPSLQPLHLRIRACLRQTNMRLDVPRLDAWRLDSDITPDAITAAIISRSDESCLPNSSSRSSLAFVSLSIMVSSIRDNGATI